MAAPLLFGPRGNDDDDDDGERHEHRNATETVTALEANTVVCLLKNRSINLYLYSAN